MQFRKTDHSTTATLLAGLLLASCFAITLAPESQCRGYTSAKKPTLTGEYDYKHGRNEGELYIKQLKPHKVQFALKCLWIGNVKTGDVHTGQASGVVELDKDGSGTFQNPAGFTLKFAFMPNQCTVECTEGWSVFGGMNVDPNGKYRKVSAKIPTAGDLEAYQ